MVAIVEALTFTVGSLSGLPFGPSLGLVSRLRWCCERADPPNSIFPLEYSDAEFAMRRLGRAVGVQKSANLTCYVDDGYV